MKSATKITSRENRKVSVLVSARVEKFFEGWVVVSRLYLMILRKIQWPVVWGFFFFLLVFSFIINGKNFSPNYPPSNVLDENSWLFRTYLIYEHLIYFSVISINQDYYSLYFKYWVRCYFIFTCNSEYLSLIP